MCFGIANLSVSGCSGVCLRISNTVFGRINTCITNTFWMLSNNRSFPYKIKSDGEVTFEREDDREDREDVANNRSFPYKIKPDCDVTLDFEWEDSEDVENNCVTIDFDIVSMFFYFTGAHGFITLTDVSYQANLNFGEFSHILCGNSLVSSITVKPSKPVKGISLNINNFIKLNINNFRKLDEKCIEFLSDNYMEDIGYTEDIDTYTYNLPFVYDVECGCWTLQLQEFIDKDRNINYADCTINLSKLGSSAEQTHASLVVDKFEDTDISLYINMLQLDIGRYMRSMVGISYSK